MLQAFRSSYPKGMPGRGYGGKKRRPARCWGKIYRRGPRGGAHVRMYRERPDAGAPRGERECAGGQSVPRPRAARDRCVLSSAERCVCIEKGGAGGAWEKGEIFPRAARDGRARTARPHRKGLGARDGRDGKRDGIPTGTRAMYDSFFPGPARDGPFAAPFCLTKGDDGDII